jgi:hypothetical protein
MQGNWSVKPFALHLLEEHWNGKTVEQLARETGITAERIEIRLEVATAYLQWLSEIGGTGELLSEEAQSPEKRDWKPERRAASAEKEHLIRALRHGINRACYSWSPVDPNPPICTCGHADIWHLQKVGPCVHHEVWNYCGCDHFQQLRVQAPLSTTICPLSMEVTALPSGARQK